MIDATFAATIFGGIYLFMIGILMCVGFHYFFKGLNPPGFKWREPHERTKRHGRK